VAYANRARGKHIITSSIEHHAVFVSCEFLEKEGFRVTYLPVDSDGLIDPDTLLDAIKSDTTLVSIMHANNETGVIQDIRELVRISHEAGAYFHTDAVQSTGKIPYKVSELGCDLLSISAHKLYGPKGVGLLYIKSGTKIQPWNQGGGHEMGRRAGTENVAGIVGLTKALEIAQRDMEMETAKLTRLTADFLKAVRARIPDIHVNGSLEHRVPNTLNISFRGIEGESVILSLDLRGISVSSGSACTSGTTHASHVLVAMGIPNELAHGSVRFSFGRSNSDEDIEYVVDVLRQEVERLRSMSPLSAQ
jgi:cysteine desulfurase